MTPPLSQWLVAFVLTNIFEAPVYYLLLRRHIPNVPALLALVFLLNCTTHPALWYLFPRFLPYALWVVVAELTVATVEGLLIAVALRFRPNVRTALQIGLTASLLANVTSTLLGLLIAHAADLF